MVQSVGPDDRDFGEAFFSFVWRTRPLARLNTYASDAVETQLPFLPVGAPIYDSKPPGAAGLFRFIHQCFGIPGELIAILAISVATGLSILGSGTGTPEAKPPIQKQQSTVPNAAAPGPNQNDVPNAATPNRRPSDPTLSFDRLPQTQSQPAGPSGKIPNRDAEPEKANPRTSQDLKADTPGVKKE